MDSPSAARNRMSPWLLLLALAVACTAVSTQSIWIDEAQTANAAIHPTLRGCWDSLYAVRNSDVQMPLYMLYTWSWARVFGVSEVSLRAENVLFFFLGFFAIWHFVRHRPGLRNAVLLVYCVHPFVWYYIDEARPYSMQLGGALLAAGAVFSALAGEDEAYSASWWWLFTLGMVLVCGAGMLGVPWAMVAAGVMAAQPRCWQSIRRGGLIPFLVLCLSLMLLAAFYLWTIHQKVAAAQLNTNLGSAISILYDQLGFMGLGPSRNTLREQSVRVFMPHLLPIALLAIPLAWSLGAGMRQRFNLPAKQFTIAVMVPAVLGLLILAAGCVRHNRILGRHFTPFFPILLFALGSALLILWRRGRMIDRVMAALLIAMLTCSSLEVRFAARHAKDDYRDVVAAAEKALAQGRVVWWAAGIDGARYYKLPIAWDTSQAGFAVWTIGVPASSGPPPDDVFLSKIDLFDPAHNLMPYLQTHDYRAVAEWPAFTQWKKAAAKTP